MSKNKIVFLILIISIVFLIGCTKNETEEDYLCPDCNVILISIDTLRADHLGVYGYNRNTSPNIDKFAQQSIIFENAYSQSPLTAPSHMTMFTSLYFSAHGINNIVEIGNEIAKTQRLSDSIVTLPQILKEKGYTTTAFTGGGEITGSLGFDRGFDIYREDDLIRRKAFTDAVIKYNNIPEEYKEKLFIEEMLKWLEKNQNDKFFLFVHTYTTHGPYISPYPDKFSPNYTGDDRWKDYFQGYYSIYSQYSSYTDESKKIDNIMVRFFTSVNKSNKREVDNLIALYDSSIFYMDENIKLLFDKIDELDLSDNTVIIFTSDHGEEFLEHGHFGHFKLYKEHIHVPLIIHLPMVINKTIKENVGLIDLTPTILDILNIDYRPKNYEFQGVSLTPLLKNNHLGLDIYSESHLPLKKLRYYSLITKDNWKYIFLNHTSSSLKSESGEIVKKLFNLLEDPKEKKNLVFTNIESVIPIEKKIKKIQEENKKLNEKLNQELTYVETDNETIEKLKSLGYVG